MRLDLLSLRGCHGGVENAFQIANDWQVELELATKGHNSTLNSLAVIWRDPTATGPGNQGAGNDMHRRRRGRLYHSDPPG